MFGAGNDALGWELMALQAVDDALVIADVRGRKRCPGLGAYGPTGRVDALGWDLMALQAGKAP